tara:strand:- start:12243 stop:13016 length:774 start_codon:yes stop_codon:yes gene_type:complete
MNIHRLSKDTVKATDFYFNDGGWNKHWTTEINDVKFVPVPEDYDGPVFTESDWRSKEDEMKKVGDVVGMPYINYSNLNNGKLELPDLAPGTLIVYRCVQINTHGYGSTGILKKAVITSVSKSMGGFDTFKIVDKDTISVMMTTSWILRGVSKAGKVLDSFPGDISEENPYMTERVNAPADIGADDWESRKFVRENLGEFRKTFMPGVVHMGNHFNSPEMTAHRIESLARHWLHWHIKREKELENEIKQLKEQLNERR